MIGEASFLFSFEILQSNVLLSRTPSISRNIEEKEVCAVCVTPITSSE